MAVKTNKTSGKAILEPRLALANLLDTNEGKWVHRENMDSDGEEEQSLTLMHKDVFGEQDFAITISSGEVMVCEEMPRGFIRKSTPHLGLRASGECMGAFLQLIKDDLNTYHRSCHLVRESYTKHNVKEMAEQIRTSQDVRCEFGGLKVGMKRY